MRAGAPTGAREGERPIDRVEESVDVENREESHPAAKLVNDDATRDGAISQFLLLFFLAGFRLSARHWLARVRRHRCPFELVPNMAPDHRRREASRTCTVERIASSVAVVSPLLCFLARGCGVNPVRLFRYSTSFPPRANTQIRVVCRVEIE
ncbi:hypothetical protein ABZP36_013343 [Zizania latifolia]